MDARNRVPLVALCQELPESGDLPTEIDLESFVNDMSKLWERSIRDIDRGRVTEWGAVLSLDSKGNLRLVNEVEGDSNGVMISSAVEEDCTFIGTFHTHPYEDGTTGMAFTGADIASMINSGERIAIVQSGEYVFALLRTPETPPSVDRLTLVSWFNTMWRRHFADMMSKQEATLATNLDMCAEYGLAFYYGRVFENLRKVYAP